MKGFLRAARDLFASEKGVPVDAELDGRLRAFHDHVDRLRKVRVAMQLYSDAVDTLSKAESVLADALSTYYQHSVPTAPSSDAAAAAATSFPAHGVAHSLKNLMGEKFSVVRGSINGILQNRCIKPVTAVLAKVAPLEEKVKQRKALLHDHDTHRSLLQKEQESGKPGDDPSILRQSVKLDEVSLNLGRVVSAVDASLLEFEKARPLMLVQELAAVVGVFYYHGTATTALVGRLLPLLPQAASTLCLLNALGSNKQRPSPSPGVAATEGLQAVEVAVMRKSIMGGRYGGYGLLDDDGLPAPMPPLQSRESLAQSRRDAGADFGRGSSELLPVSAALQPPSPSQQPQQPQQLDESSSSPSRSPRVLPTRTPSFRAPAGILDAMAPTIVAPSSSSSSSLGRAGDDGTLSSDDEEELLRSSLAGQELSGGVLAMSAPTVPAKLANRPSESAPDLAKEDSPRTSTTSRASESAPELTNKRSSVAVVSSLGIVSQALAAGNAAAPPKAPKPGQQQRKDS